MSNVRAVRESLVEAARRHSRVAHEVEDLAHDVVVAALRRGLALDDESFVRGVHGAARRHGAFLARSACRRRAREVGATTDHSPSDDAERHPVEGAPLSVLSPTLRTTLLLLALGLDKAELRVALGVTDPALRKRFQALRDHAPLARPELTVPSRTPTVSRLRRSQVQLLPRLATVGDRPTARVLGAGDPDGHGIIFAEVLTKR